MPKYIYLSLIIGLISCTEKVKESALNPTNSIIELSEKKITLEKDSITIDIIGVVDGHNVDDFLLLRSLEFRNSFLIYRNDDFKYCGKIFDYGQGPKEYLNLSTQAQYFIDSKDDIYLWTSDATQGKLRLTNLSSYLKDSTIHYEKEYKLPSGLFNIYYINDSLIIGDFFNGTNSHYVSYNLHNRKIDLLFKFFKDDLTSNDITSTSSAATLKPDDSMVAYAMLFYNQIIISSLDGSTVHSFSIGEPVQSETVIQNKNSYDYFSQIISTNNQIWTLYQGVYAEQRESIDYCSTVLVFDWEGHLLYEFDMGKNLSTFFFNKDKKVLFGLGVDEILYQYNIENFIE